MATCCTSLPRTLTRSSEWEGNLLPMYKFFCSGSRPGGSARLGSRRQLCGEMQKLRRKSCQAEIGVE